LLDLEPKEELQLTHHAHLKFPTHVFCKPCNKRDRRATKDNIIHVYLHNQDIFALPEEKQSLINLPHLKTSLKQEPLNLPYQALGACFNPYNAFDADMATMLMSMRGA
jgi:hypothetical protein